MKMEKKYKLISLSLLCLWGASSSELSAFLPLSKNWKESHSSDKRTPKYPYAKRARVNQYGKNGPRYLRGVSSVRRAQQSLGQPEEEKRLSSLSSISNFFRKSSPTSEERNVVTDEDEDEDKENQERRQEFLDRFQNLLEQIGDNDLRERVETTKGNPALLIRIISHLGQMNGELRIVNEGLRRKIEAMSREKSTWTSPLAQTSVQYRRPVGQAVPPQRSLSTDQAPKYEPLPGIPPPPPAPPPPPPPAPPPGEIDIGGKKSQAPRPQAPAPQGGNAGASHLDLIRGGHFQLRKVDPNAPKGESPLPPPPMSHLDLIKAGAFRLNKVDRDAWKNSAPKTQAEEDPSQLSLQDILQKAASIREAVAVSDSSSADEKTESTAW
ncbi:MAG: hypothetical protein LBG09_00010 [Puniceicoccales bacterium]|jgi:hypothetical protein|nr:hypothetical protein [Puniceicoccales bacterium]